MAHSKKEIVSVFVFFFLFVIIYFGFVFGSVYDKEGKCNVIQSCLVLNLNFDEGSGNKAKDNSEYGNDGSIKGAKFVEGVSGKALEFDGKDDRIDTTLSVNQKTGAEATFCAWIYQTGGWAATLFSTDNGGYDWQLRTNPVSNEWNIFTGNGAWVPGPKADFNTWKHICATWNSTEIMFVKDGVAYYYGSGADYDDYTENLVIGIRYFGGDPNRPDGESAWKGKIDEVKIWNKALTAEEIKAEYEKFKPKENTSLVLNLNFDEGSGNKAKDNSEYGNDGSIKGAKFVEGVSGKALEFDGDDYIDLTSVDKNLKGLSTVAVSVWAKHNSIPGAILAQHQPKRGIRIGLSAEGYPIFGIKTTHSEVRGYNWIQPLCIGNEIVSSDAWNYYVWLWNNTDLAGYVNAKKVCSVNVNGMFSAETLFPNWQIYIGRDYWGSLYSAYFNGKIDEVKIWNKALTAEEIKAEYEKYKPKENTYLVLNLTFDEGSGNKAGDTSEYRNDGSIIGASWSQNCVSGKCLEFEGKQYVEIKESASLDITEKITVSAWVNIYELPGGYPGIIEKGNENAYFLRIDNPPEGNRFSFFVRNPDNTVEPRANANISTPLNKWIHVVGIYDSNNIKIYVDGILRGNSIRQGKIKTNNNPLWIGRGSAFFKGKIDELKIWNKALSEQEILDLYTNESQINKEAETDKIYQVNTSMGKTWVNKNGAIYTLFDKSVRKSDDGKTFNLIYSNPDLGERMIFIDSRNTIFTNGIHNKSCPGLFMSMGGDANWTCSLNFFEFGTCPEIGSVWFMSEDKFRNLYVGEYSYGTYNDNNICAFIFKSSDGGLSWSIVYNSSAYGWAGRHIHNVKVDPYTNYVYATQGDTPSQSRLIRSTDNGVTWTALRNGFRTNYITIEFTPRYRIFGEDAAGLRPSSRIIRTSDDINFEVVATLSADEAGNWWTSTQNSEGTMYMGTVVETPGKHPVIYKSDNEGKSWVKIKDFGASPISWVGISHISNFDLNGEAYFVNEISRKAYKLR